VPANQSRSRHSPPAGAKNHLPRALLFLILYILLVHPLPRLNAMSTEVLCPKPQRPHRRALADIDSDALPVSKRARRSPPPLPTPSTHGQRSESPHPPRRPSSQSLEDLDTCTAPPKKKQQELAPFSLETGPLCVYLILDFGSLSKVANMCSF